jgi:hypothetical protein
VALAGQRAVPADLGAVEGTGEGVGGGGLAQAGQRVDDRGPADPVGCCASLKMPMKAALVVPMWGCSKAPQPAGCGALVGVVPVVVGEVPVTSVTAERAAASSTMALPAA